MNEVGCEGWGAVLWRAGDERCAVPWFAGPAVRTVRGWRRRGRAEVGGVRGAGFGVLRGAGWRRAEVRCAAGRGLAARGGGPSAAVGFRYQTEGGPTGRLPYL